MSSILTSNTQQLTREENTWLWMEKILLLSLENNSQNKMKGGKKQLGRNRSKWEDNIKMDL